MNGAVDNFPVPYVTSTAAVMPAESVMSLRPEEYRLPEATKTPEDTQDTIEDVKTRLANHIRGKWETHKQHRQTVGIDNQFMASKKACARQYEDQKLNDIRAYEQNPKYDPPYHPIIDVKCRALNAKMSAKVMAPGDRPWNIDPTPVPEVPGDLRKQMEQELAYQVANEAFTQGTIPSIEDVDRAMPQIEKNLLTMMTKRSKTVNEEAKTRLDDQLREGGWYEAIKECLYDFARKPYAVIKGPIQKSRKKYSHEYNELSQQWETVVVDEKLDTWSRVAAEKFYPAPNSNKINDGDTIELSSYTRKGLYDAKDIEGYDEAAIRRVLKQWASGGLHECTTLDYERATVDQKSSTDFGSDLDCLIYYGTVSGEILLEWGMTEDVITDPDDEYNIWAELIGSEVIMARINPDPLGKKPYFKASLVEDPDKFGGGSVPDILYDLSGVCCAVLRAAHMNSAYSSRPITDVAVDQLENRNMPTVTPGMVIRRTTDMMKDLARPVNFFQPRNDTGPLSAFLDFCETKADEWTGIMRISHGGDTAGGADSTASGMSMNISESGVGVKLSLSNFDDGIIGPSVTAQYLTNLRENPGGFWSSPYLDPKIVARGSSSSSMLAKEQQAVRRVELHNSLSPEDKQIMGLEGMKEDLKGRILALDLDPDKWMPEEQQALQRVNSALQLPPGQAAQAMLPAPGAQTLNAAGDKSGGRDFALPM